MNTGFLIVGGGIGGLVLAELLSRGGKKVVVLERSTSPPPWNRPELLWPATIELLCKLHPRERWLEDAALPLSGAQVFDRGKFRWVASPAILDRAGVHPWSTNPHQTRELLMRLASFELCRGVEVKEVLKEHDRIVGVRSRNVATGEERDWPCDCTIGDDGANSLVRQACGIELTTMLLPLDLLCFQCDWPAALAPDAVHLWPNQRRPKSGILGMGIMPIPHGKAVGIVPSRARIFDDLPRAREAWGEFIQREPTLWALAGAWRFPEDLQRVRRPWGHAPRYGGSGAILMGDAAHPVSPAGGQGANMSVADGRAIAELALAGERNLVAAYEARRRPANARSMRFTRIASTVFGLPDSLLFNHFTAWAIRQVGRQPALVVRLIRRAATAFLERDR